VEAPAGSASGCQLRPPSLVSAIRLVDPFQPVAVHRVVVKQEIPNIERLPGGACSRVQRAPPSVVATSTPRAPVPSPVRPAAQQS
jgi:hypothetical protein